jgi:ketosteroid isomerase-like protein
MKYLFTTFTIVIAVMMFSGSAMAQTDKEIADAVIKMAKGQWADEIANPGKASDEAIADDYTEFNQDFPTRIDGKAMADRLYEALSNDGSTSTAAEMANAKVQVYNGDTAILTYNYQGVYKDKDGKTMPSLAKSTRVYVKISETWKLVHANFAPLTLRDND